MRRSRLTVFMVTGLVAGTILGSCTEARTAPRAMVISQQSANAPVVAESAAEAPAVDEPVAGVPAETPEAAADGVTAPEQPEATVPDDPRTYTILGVGDIMMGSDWPEPGMDPRVIPGGDPAMVMGPALAAIFGEADAVFGNYEGTIHTSDEDAKTCGNPEFCYVFRSPPFHADYLRRAGFTIMSHANNHARDFGESGRTATYENLTRTGMAVAGGDRDGMRIGIQTLDDGRRVALVAFGHNPGLLSVQNYARVGEMVRAADAQADIVMVSCHIGAEGARYDRVTRETEMYLEEDRGNPFRFARAAVDAGADIVFCHGPHIPRAVEVYQGRFIAYSLSNFWTYGRFNLRGHNGLAPVARLEVDGEGALVSADIVSARQDRPGGPYLDRSNAAAQRTAVLTARDFPESRVRIGFDGRLDWPR
ncbi:CapA family protein [Parasphingopyxis algicola]|uniref:CapA family protein n=1 Tax=Parasphingopyxis algicola TaxID=2026624 RepID=UPI0015A4BE2C|nr:CapA family protein [Parasphingopyxis algicola]QLC26171.1 CapA family protein [Parasphingopyxis algicola]